MAQWCVSCFVSRTAAWLVNSRYSLCSHDSKDMSAQLLLQHQSKGVLKPGDFSTLCIPRGSRWC